MGYGEDQFAGVATQLPPDVEQVVGAEGQTAHAPGSPPPVIGLPEKRTPPLPTRGVVATAVPIVTEEGVVVEPEPVPEPVIVAEYPILKVNRYSGTDQDYQELVRWDIPTGMVGDLHEISLVSDNDTLTRYRIIIGNVDQQLPTDRATQTPVSFPWRQNTIPGGSTVYVAVLSTDGTSINVDGMISGTERVPQ